MPKLSASVAEDSPPSDGFTKGSILRIALKDFMTYTRVECFPGRALNLIIGPNGTGKSTIVSAICLGMAGKPSTLARANSVGGYVRNGADKALIEIELYNPNGQNYVISREITRDNRSSWKLQGKSVTQGEVEKVTQSLHIQVDNLCQFLPQEQVQNFSRMKDKDLLIGTMSAVGKPGMEPKFSELIKLQGQLGAVSGHQGRDEVELNKLKGENERLEAEVRNYKERESLKLKVKLLEKKKAWLVYKEELDTYKKAANDANELKSRYEEAHEKFKPLEDEIAKKDKLISRSTDALRTKRERFCNEATKVNTHLMNVESKKSKMTSLNDDLNKKRVAEKKRQDDIVTLKSQIRGLEEDVEELARKEQDAGGQLQQINQQLSDLTYKDTVAHQTKDSAHEEVRQLKMEREACHHQLIEIENVDRTRFNILRQDCRSVAEGVDWLRQNKGRFRRPIYEPLILSLNMKNMEMAKYLENRVSFNDMSAFFCEDKEDMNQLMRILRDEMRLSGINVVHAPPSDEPSTVEFQPRITISELRDYGFHSYLRELFTGPEPIIRYLCRNYDVHNIPVGNEHAYEQLGTIREHFGNSFKIFYGGNKMISFRSSRYRRDLITQMDELRPAKWLNRSVDAQRLEHLRATHQELSHRYETACRALENAVQDARAVAQEKESLYREKNQMQKLGADKRVAASRLKHKQESLKGLESDAVDLKAEELRVKRECANCFRSCTEYLSKHAIMVDQLLNCDKDLQVLQLYVDILRTSVLELRKQLSAEKDQIKQLKAASDEAARVQQAAKDRCAAALKEARQLTGVQKFEQLPEEVQEKLAELPDTVSEVDETIHTCNARIQLMGRGDSKVLDDYMNRCRRIEELSEKIHNINTETAELKQKIKDLREEFLPPLLDLINRININFGRYYASMQCAGEVCLYTGEGEDQSDFKNYGIKIRVKYRSAEPLQDLSANHHSGGERAVATALYMLAMQELTQVPFRCVDEINQGMDPINERRVFDLLVQTACQETSAQYFLLTPKLLTGLNYSPYMKIHFVHNGEEVMDYKKWNIKKHLKSLRALNAAV